MTTFDTVAAVDLGSNSFHMVVARLVDGVDLQVMDRIKEPIRLAGGLQPDGCLSDEAITRALGTLERFGERVREMPQGSVRAVGTHTLRKARNGAMVLHRGEEALGHHIEIISGWEEARLVYRGVVGDQPREGRLLVVDIGGGSTEVITGQGSDPRHLESLYMGCVSWSRRFFGSGAIDAASFERAITAARLELGPHFRKFREFGWDAALGSSGTIHAVERIVLDNGMEKAAITPRALGRLREAMIEAGSVEAIALAGLQEDRREVLAGGVAILSAVFDSLRVDSMRSAPTALREGVLFELVGRFAHQDVRDQAVRAFARHFEVDDAQARRVGRTALAMFDQLARSWKLDTTEHRRLLGWAARLHEIGMVLSHAGHHKHGAYLLQNADLAGFSRQQQRSLAALVLSHRRKLSKRRLHGLLGRRVGKALRVAVPLRLAVRLHRPRSDRPLPELTLRARGKKLHLAIAGDWLDEHPLARADLADEAELLAAAGFTLTFG